MREVLEAANRHQLRDERQRSIACLVLLTSAACAHDPIVYQFEGRPYDVRSCPSGAELRREPSAVFCVDEQGRNEGPSMMVLDDDIVVWSEYGAGKRHGQYLQWTKDGVLFALGQFQEGEAAGHLASLSLERRTPVRGRLCWWSPCRRMEVPLA
jgi:hypothetical protein